MGETVVEKVREGVIISEPFLKSKDDKASKLADDPEFTINPYFFPKSFVIFSSNFFTDGPSIKLREFLFNTLTAADISLLSYMAFP